MMIMIKYGYYTNMGTTQRMGIMIQSMGVTIQSMGTMQSMGII